MDDRKSTPKAVVVSAILHLGIVGFLFLATLSCSSFSDFFNSIGLGSLNPITCTPPPLQLTGQVIEATLMGNTGSPPPKAVKTKPIPNTVPPPPSATPPPTPPPPTPPKIKTLPPPPDHPDVKDQERVVEDAAEKADDATKLQEEKQKQRQSEIDAQAVKKKEEQEKVDQLFKQLDAASAQTQKADSKAKQAKQQLQDAQNASDNAKADLPKADQLQSGTNSATTDLTSQYAAAIQNAVTQNWLRPDNMPSSPCEVHIVQLPGGDVLSAKVDSSCPYDDAGKRSVENAVLRATPLPYKGFEKVFQRQIDFTFRPQ